MQVKTDAQARTGPRVYNSVERALIEEIRKETRNDAADELERLNREQYQTSAIEAQMAAFFANLNRQITDNRLDEAGGTIQSMRNFINTPAFAALRSIQARKSLYTQAIDSFDTMVEETKKYQAALNSDASFSDSQARIARLEKDLAEKNKTVEALSSQGSGASRRLNELEKTNSSLQADNKKLTTDLDRQTRSATSLQQSVNTLQKSVNDLRQSERDLQTENTRLTQTVATRDNTISSNENTIKDLRQQNDSQTQRINRIKEVVQGKAAVNMTLGELNESVNKIQEILNLNQ